MSEDLPGRSRKPGIVVGIVGLGVAVAATALLIGGTDGGSDTPPAIDPSTIELVSYGDCDTALRELKQAALEHVDEFGVGIQYGGAVPEVATGGDGDSARAAEGNSAQDGGAAAPMAEAPADAKAAEAPAHSGTNTHEEGVDEPDLVKTDGRRLVTIADGTLRVVDVASRAQTGTLELPGGYATQLLIDGDRALVLSGNGYAVDMPMPMPRGMKPGSPPYDGPTEFPTQLVLVDLSGAPAVLGTLAVDGSYLDARQVGSVARVVVRSMPRLEYTYPDGVRTPELAELENRAIVEQSAIGDWLPRYQLTQGGATSTGQLPDCASVSHPQEYTGSAMLTVLTLDLQRELGTGEPVTIVADGDTVYGTGANLYVADDHIAHAAGTDPAAPAGQRTEFYQFDISKPGKPVHVASGGVEGTLLNQYSLSEHDGHLRIATTVQGEQSQSMVSVLARRDNVLAQVGQVSGLGLGERIYSVRFIGDTGYVVTFRETDPLYTVDLSDPASPAVTGELKITGYSAYLHPAGDGRLIGVGQEASTQGQTTGTQVSLFDTSNRAGATRVAQYHLENAYSEAETDPHAFLYWPDAGLIVLPVNGYEMTTDGMPVGGALVLRLEGDSFTEIARISHEMTYEGGGPGPVAIAPRRTLVIGADLWTVSEAGVKVNALDGMAELAWVPFT